MDGSQPGTGIDPRVIREHGAEPGALDEKIREIESDALKLQRQLALARPMPRPAARHWWRRSA